MALGSFARLPGAAVVTASAAVRNTGSGAESFFEYRSSFTGGGSVFFFGFVPAPAGDAINRTTDAASNARAVFLQIVPPMDDAQVFMVFLPPQFAASQLPLPLNRGNVISFENLFHVASICIGLFSDNPGVFANPADLGHPTMGNPLRVIQPAQRN